MSDLFKTTFHRDGSVTFWNVYTQLWETCDSSSISDSILASLPANERERIIAKRDA